jgi:hypothetical protein
MSNNTFKGANTSFPNTGIHFLLAEIVKFRKQLTVRSELRSQSGWDNSLNNYMVAELEKLRDTIENIAYNPDNITQEELESQASDTTRSLADDYNARALASDNVLMPVGVVYDVVWDLTGANSDLPQMTPDNCPNDVFRSFITLLDRLFVESTRLDSRFQATHITKYEAVMLVSLINQLYTLCQRKGGEANKSDTPQGTLPSQEPLTFMGKDAKNSE